MSHPTAALEFCIPTVEDEEVLPDPAGVAKCLSEFTRIQTLVEGLSESVVLGLGTEKSVSTESEFCLLLTGVSEDNIVETARALIAGDFSTELYVTARQPQADDIIEALLHSPSNVRAYVEIVDETGDKHLGHFNWPS